MSKLKVEKTLSNKQKLYDIYKNFYICKQYYEKVQHLAKYELTMNNDFQNEQVIIKIISIEPYDTYVYDECSIPAIEFVKYQDKVLKKLTKKEIEKAISNIKQLENSENN
jgi:hypothetical protein